MPISSLRKKLAEASCTRLRHMQVRDIYDDECRELICTTSDAPTQTAAGNNAALIVAAVNSLQQLLDIAEQANDVAEYIDHYGAIPHGMVGVLRDSIASFETDPHG